MTTTQQTIFYGISSTRLRVRRVNETALADAARSTDGKWHIKVRNGGSVANSYGYRADTEAALAVSDPHGTVVVWVARLSANKVTARGSAEACLCTTGDLFDARVLSAARKATAWDVIKRAHALAVIKQTNYGRVEEAIAPGALNRMTVEDLRASGVI